MLRKLAPAILLVVCACSKTLPESIQKATARPANIITERVVGWSLKLNGTPFSGNHHVLKLNEKVDMEGHATPADDSIPLGTNPDFVVSLRPKGENPNGEWSAVGVRNSHLEFKAHVLQGKAKRSPKIKEQWFEAGEYDARLYYVIIDDFAGQTTVDLLATATISIVE